LWLKIADSSNQRTHSAQEIKLDWRNLPDVAAIALLTCAFASVARQHQTRSSNLWLIAWVTIGLHFFASIFVSAPGLYGSLASLIALSALTWAAGLFMWASVTYSQEHSHPGIPALLMLANTIYISVAVFAPSKFWLLTAAASLFGVFSLTLMLFALRKFHHPLRWTTALLYGALTVFLLLVQHRPSDGIFLAINAILFTCYFSCCIHFICKYRRATAGALITIAGFFFWSMVFVAAPSMSAFWPQTHIEDEVWNLPKYLVAIGMILLLLENQIEHNKHLALHDALTGLPNRRLFQDRLSRAIERARRTCNQAALLVIDLDHFKEVNDTLGHHVGDLLLQRVATIISSRIRRSDTVARTGGDEFSLILEEPVSIADASRIANALTNRLKEPIELDGHIVHIGASVGIALFPDDAPSLESLCIAADQRMYANKHTAAKPIDDSFFLKSANSHAKIGISSINF
jgi:diguanylate cyclase (GGDEF)-like protein